MTSDVERMRILVITGSVRPGNYTLKASALVIDELRKDPMVRAELVDPQTLDLPWPGTRAAAEATRHLQQKVKEAAGVVLATPEYHGSFSSVMKLVIENLATRRSYPASQSRCWVWPLEPSARLNRLSSFAASVRTSAPLRSLCPLRLRTSRECLMLTGGAWTPGRKNWFGEWRPISLTISVGTYARRFSSNAFCGKGWPSVSFTSSRSTRAPASDEHRCTLESLVPGSTAVAHRPTRCVVAPRRWVKYSDTS